MVFNTTVSQKSSVNVEFWKEVRFFREEGIEVRRDLEDRVIYLRVYRGKLRGKPMTPPPRMENSERYYWMSLRRSCVTHQARLFGSKNTPVQFRMDITIINGSTLLHHDPKRFWDGRRVIDVINEPRVFATCELDFCVLHEPTRSSLHGTLQQGNLKSPGAFRWHGWRR